MQNVELHIVDWFDGGHTPESSQLHLQPDLDNPAQETLNIDLINCSNDGTPAANETSTSSISRTNDAGPEAVSPQPEPEQSGGEARPVLKNEKAALKEKRRARRMARQLAEREIAEQKRELVEPQAASDTLDPAAGVPGLGSPDLGDNGEVNLVNANTETQKAEVVKAQSSDENHFEASALAQLEPSSHPVRTTYINRQNQLQQETYALAAERSGDEEVNLVKTNTEVPESHLVRAEDSNMNILEAPVLAQHGFSSNLIWAAFINCRTRLLQEAVRDSVLKGKFNDVEIHAYSQRSKRGGVSTPIIVHARTSFLEASSPVLKELSRVENRTTRFIPTAASDYDYEDDSDLEDIEDDDRDSEISDIASNASSFDILLDSTDRPPQAAREGDARVDHPASHRGTGTPVMFMHDIAAKTWQALLLYLYNDRISFAPLKSRLPKLQSSNDRAVCSPKSMYRLATKLELDELRKLSESAIIEDISAENIVEELFSDFTRRYPDILSREVDLFTKYASQPEVRDKLNQFLKDVAVGKLPHGQIVLTALFDHLLPPITP